ncbi:hypothetical protein [Paraburkholderia strydomiana]
MDKDNAQTVQWYSKAAAQGEADSESALGSMYETGLGGLVKDDAQAVQWFHQGGSTRQCNSRE